MRIGIDARFLTHPQPGGFKTYTENLIAALAEIDQKNDYILYLDRPPGAHAPLKQFQNMTCRVIRGELPILGMPFREQLGLLRATHRDHLDLLHSPALTAPLFLSCPLVLTLHDMIWKTLPSGNQIAMKRRLLNSYYELVPSLAARKATTIITVSQAAKADIVNQLGISPENIVVTYEAAAPAFKPLSNPSLTQEVARKFSLPPKFLMAIGSADPRKNIESLLHAYVKLPISLREVYHLVIVWTHSHLADSISRRVQALGLGKQCHFLFSVSKKEMVSLYNLATLFVFPSRYEGFGLPPLEAMSCKTPVLSANNSSLPEVVGGGGYLFDADDIETMADLIQKLLVNEAERLELAERGFRHSANFSWAKCASETVAVYHKVFSSSRN